MSLSPCLRKASPFVLTFSIYLRYRKTHEKKKIRCVLIFYPFHDMTLSIICSSLHVPCSGHKFLFQYVLDNAPSFVLQNTLTTISDSIWNITCHESKLDRENIGTKRSDALCLIHWLQLRKKHRQYCCYFQLSSSLTIALHYSL
jgi:hypothetical protein